MSRIVLMDVDLVSGKLGDSQSFAVLDRLCFDERLAYSEEMFRELLSAKNVQSAVAVSSSDQMTGFAILMTMFGRIQYGHLITIDVHPQFRRKGIGRLLIENMESTSIKKGLLKIILEVYTQNREALRFYGSLNYQVLGTIPDYYGPRQDAYIMIKELRNNRK